MFIHEMCMQANGGARAYYAKAHDCIHNHDCQYVYVHITINH